MKIVLIAAMAGNGIIGKDGKMPWHSKEEFRHFRKTTLGYPVLMGRKTFESIGQPLEGRLNIILSRDKHKNNELKNNTLVFDNLDAAIDFCKLDYTKIFICGGAQIYKQTIKIADEIILSKFHFNAEGDTYFPDIIDDEWQITKEEEFSEFTVFYYERKTV